MNNMLKDNGFMIPTRSIGNGLPFEEISFIAEMESYRKELNRPIYYLQKWWARRLGSVFRAIIIASIKSNSNDVLKSITNKNIFKSLRIYDPFMGSGGTTVGEAHKLGCTALGKDINPVAYRSVKASLGELDFNKVDQFYKRLKRNVGGKLRDFYKGKDSEGRTCDVLYYFWVKMVSCSACENEVDLFSSYVFAKHA